MPLPRDMGNYHVLANCHDAHACLPAHAQRALVEYRDATVGDGDEPCGDDAGDIAEEVVSIKRRVFAPENEHRAMQEIVEAEADHLE